MDRRLLEACMSGDEQSLQALIQHDPLILHRAVTCCQETPLHAAVLCGHISLARALLGLKPKLASEADATGCLPLHLAAAEGGAEIVRELLGADAELINTRDHDGRTPLHLAVMKGRLDVMRELIRVCPESALQKLDCGETVFHLAVRYCRLEALKLLVELLKDDHPQLLVATDDEGNTVLHFAAFFKQIQIVRYLVSIEEVKAIGNATNGNGHTPGEIVEKSPRDFSSFKILEELTQVGVRGCRNQPNYPGPTIVLHSLPPMTTTTVNSIPETGSRIMKWLDHKMDWIVDAQGNLMVVATVVASMAFQAGINPPGGVWQEDTVDKRNCTKPDMCRAGTAVFKNEAGFDAFYTTNTWALLAAVGVVLLRFGGLPLKNMVCTWLMTLVTCVMLDSILAAYISSMGMVLGAGPESKQNKSLLFIKYAWKYMLTFVVTIHTARFYWFMFNKSLSLLPGSIFRRFKRVRVVLFVGVTSVAGVGLIIFAGFNF